MHQLGEQALGGGLGVLGGDPGIIWGLADVRFPVVVAVTDDGLTAGGNVLPADISADALLADNVFGLGFCDGHTGGHAGDSSGECECGQGSCDTFRSSKCASSASGGEAVHLSNGTRDKHLCHLASTLVAEVALGSEALTEDLGYSDSSGCRDFRLSGWCQADTRLGWPVLTVPSGCRSPTPPVVPAVVLSCPRRLHHQMRDT
jgi:hypothetical protein